MRWLELHATWDPWTAEPTWQKPPAPRLLKLHLSPRQALPSKNGDGLKRCWHSTLSSLPQINSPSQIYRMSPAPPDACKMPLIQTQNPSVGCSVNPPMNAAIPARVCSPRYEPHCVKTQIQRSHGSRRIHQNQLYPSHGLNTIRSGLKLHFRWFFYCSRYCFFPSFRWLFLLGWYLTRLRFRIRINYPTLATQTNAHNPWGLNLTATSVNHETI